MLDLLARSAARGLPPALPSCIITPPQSKIALYVNRYHLVHQRLRRNRLFRPTHWAGVAGAQGQECELTELKALLGLVGQSKYVLGFLSQPREGEYALEDLSARLPLDIQDAERTPGLFTENSIVVAEGQLQPSGRFKAVALGMPPPESRAASIEALQGLVTFGGSEPDAKEAAAWDASHPDDATLLLSDVWLDDACAMANLEALLATLAEADASSQPPPSLIVLCGDFLSPAGRRAVVGGGAAKTSAAGGAGGGLMGECRRAFDGLGRLLAQFPAVQEKSTLVLVPGPEDVGLGRALPHPGLPRAVLQGLLSAAPNTIVGSNPCRLRHGSCELVVLRSNLQCLLRGTAVVPPMPGSTPFQHAVASVAQQSHLCPVPLEVQPIHWEHDRALWLYPLPHALFLADSAPAGHHVYDSCVSLNPGSLVQGTYCSFNPFTRLGKVCSVQGKGEWQSQEAAVEMD
ncbi:POLE2 [Auxenochlorella protothecoides x Auxenochlorella symbiontica]